MKEAAHEPGDADLRQRFARLRESDLAALPAFKTPVPANTPRTATAVALATGKAAALLRAWPGAGRAGLAGTVVLAAALWFALPSRHAPRPEPPLPLVPGWRSPTDGLLAGAADPHRSTPWPSLPTAGLAPMSPPPNLELP